MVREIEIEKINEAPYNPRVKLEPGMPEWEKLKRSIEEFDNIIPLVWNERTGNLVGGHQRLSVLKSMGRTTADCSVVDLDENEEKILNIALNKIKGKWDYDKLAELLSGFDEQVASLSGFAAEEIAVLLANNDDLMGDEDEDYSEWDVDGDEQIIGGSYVVTLVFASAYIAEQWAEQNGYEGQIKEGTTTTVIRIEE